MENIEKQLVNLPKFKLSKTKDLKLRFLFFKLMLSERINMSRPILIFSAKAALGSLLVVIIIFPVYAYASDNVVQGDILYPAKRLIEKIEYSLTPGQPAKAQKNLKFTERRLNEAEAIQKRENIPQKNNKEENKANPVEANSGQKKAEVSLDSEKFNPLPKDIKKNKVLADKKTENIMATILDAEKGLENARTFLKDGASEKKINAIEEKLELIINEEKQKRVDQANPEKSKKDEKNFRQIDKR